MNLRVVSKQLGVIAVLIGITMVFSLPWAHSALGVRASIPPAPDSPVFETRGFVALLISVFICLATGAALMWAGRGGGDGRLYRKEAMAVVGLSWVLATVLGALPFIFYGTGYRPAVRLVEDGLQPLINNSIYWKSVPPLAADQHRFLELLLDAGARGKSKQELELDGVDNPEETCQSIKQIDEDWNEAIILPNELPAPDDRDKNFRIRWLNMGISDALFESQSGFSTTGATVIADLEDPVLVPHCLLFWRSSSHFLGGLGIIVLFVVVLGQGSAGKALMQAEMPGPTKEGTAPRMQHTAWLFAGIYCGLNLVLAIVLWLYGLTAFDALCHSFGTMATGGFSTYNASLGHFDSALIDYTVVFFMVLAGTNFTLLYFLLRGQPRHLLDDVEWRSYMGAIGLVTLLVIGFGIMHGDFSSFLDAFRYGLFQVVSIITTTGYGTHDFDRWSSFGRGVLFLLMFVGGCAGSTGGGLKVIRHVLFLKILWLEIEQSYHPTVVRPLRIGGKSVESANLRKNILIYFGLILVLFVFCWMFVVTTEPDNTWGGMIEHKLIDTATSIAATLNNIGPGLGTVGATQNYGHFSWHSKLLFVWLMMLGRLELFSILVLFVPAFWRSR